MDTTPSPPAGRAPPVRLADDVRALTSVGDPDAAGNHPETGGVELCERLRERLRPLLVDELRRRVLWDAPPRFFGVFRGDSWDDEDAFAELLADAYAYVFVEHQAVLRRRAALDDALEPTVERQVRDFLVDVQRRYNPLGSLLYGLLHRAVARLLEIRRFEIVEGDEHLRHDTVLIAPHSGEYGRDVSAALQPSVAAIVDALLPDLVASWGRDQVVDELTERLFYLPTDGVLAFRFGELVGRMVHEVRQRWRALTDGAPSEGGSPEDSGDGELLALAGLADDVMSRDDVSRFLDRIENGIDQLSRSQRTRDELRRLWLFLRSWRSEGGGQPPSDQAIGKVLGIPDQRIPRLKATLGKQVLLSSRGLAAAPPMSFEARHAALRARTLEAARSRRPGERMPTDGTPRPGETYLFVPGDGDGIEWLVLAVDGEDERRHLVVPLDDFPLVGSHDVRSGEDPLSESEAIFSSRLRCAHGVWIDRSAFTPERRSGEVSEGTVAMARHRRRQMAAGFLARSPAEPYPGTMTANAVERAADEDPEYRIRMADLAIARTHLAERFGLPPPKSVRRHDLRLLAAALLGALLMAAAFVLRLC